MDEWDSKSMTVELRREGALAWLSFNRPSKRNAMNPALNRRMHELLDQIEEDASIRVVVLHGEGGNFSAGMDMKEFIIEADAHGPIAAKRIRQEAENWWHRLRWLNKATIAMVEGWCVGGAFGPLAACDLVFSANDARFLLSEVDYGLVPLGNITKIVADRLPSQNAMFHLLTAVPFSGEDAARFGLALEALPSTALRKRVGEVAHLIAAKDPATICAIKETLKKVGEMHSALSGEYQELRQQALDHERAGTVGETMQAFLTKVGGTKAEGA